MISHPRSYYTRRYAVRRILPGQGFFAMLARLLIPLLLDALFVGGVWAWRER